MALRNDLGVDTRLVVAVGRPLPGNRNDRRAGELPGAKAPSARLRSSRTAVTGYPALPPHRRDPGQINLPARKEEHNASHRVVRARVEHVFARLKTWQPLRVCRLKGDGVHSFFVRLPTASPVQRTAGHAARGPIRAHTCTWVRKVSRPGQVVRGG